MMRWLEDPLNANEIFFDGIKLTHNELKKVFERNGLVRIFPVDEVFNPELHKCLAVEKNERLKENQIISVVEKGYMLRGKVIRPASVIIIK